jgi:threonyl-tRNA synthetase
MNCPGHCLLFASKARSFRDLPIRFADFSPLHRNEISGALSGLTRVRRFHQDDGHIFCRPSQVFEEISKTLDFIKLTYSTFNLGPYRLALSTRPKDHFIGTEEEWHRAETALRNALDASGQEWSINEGDGAFYGPKIDIILKDSDGKEHQTATVQLDFQLPKRFELEYIAPAPEQEARGETTEDPEFLAKSGPVRPVMIHRAVLGSVERFMALLIEHYNGRWPFWLNPRQIAVLTVSDDPAVVAYAQNAIREMQGEVGAAGGLRPRGMHEPVFRIDLDDQPRSIKKKVSDAMRKHYSVIVVVGKKDVEENKGEIAVDFRGVPALRSSLTQALGIADAEEEKASEALKQIKLEPKRLRNILLELENSYR